MFDFARFGVRGLLFAQVLAFVGFGIGAAFAAEAVATPDSAAAVAAGSASDPLAAPAPTTKHELTAGDLEAFIDGLLPLQLETNDIAGATVAVVKDGKILFAKGYGVSDMKTRKPVSAEETLFRVGSITKLFTWTAVMQQVEMGKIDLDADVNKYLDFEIPHTHGKPVTVRNLLTHRAGFEETIKDLGIKSGSKVELESYLKTHIPAQIFEPGTVPAYSNYGAALAGYIVQRVSGVPFDKYVEDMILKPLGMLHSSLAQPLPADLLPMMSSGYNLASGDAGEFETVNAYPAGSMSAPATDMARFMIAHLNDGALGDARILEAKTAQEMHNTRTETAPPLNAMMLGFYEETRNGHRIIGHGGDTIAFHSDMHLIMDANVGFFVSYNSQGRGDTSPRSALWRKFLDRYFPYTPPDEPTLATAKDDAAKYVGSYMTSRRGESSWTKALADTGQSTVSADEDGVLTINTSLDLNGQPRKWREVAPGVYRNVAGQERIVFKEDAAGRMALYSNPIQIGQRAGVTQGAMFVTLVALVSNIVMLLNVVLWPVAAVARRHYGQRLERSGTENALRFATYLVCATNIAFLTTLGIILVPQLEAVWGLNTSLDPTIRAVQYVGIAGAAGSLLALANAVVAWGSENRSFIGRVKEITVAAACVAFAWFVWSTNLIDLGLRY